MPTKEPYYRFEDPELSIFTGTEEDRQALRRDEEDLRRVGEKLRNPPKPKPGQTQHEAMIESPFFSDEEIYGF